MDTAFSIIGKVISVGKAIWKMIEAVKALEKSRSDLQSQLNVLQGILHSIKRSDSLQNPTVYAEVHAALRNLDSIFEDAFEKCAELDLKKAIEVLRSFKDDDQKFFQKLFQKLKQLKPAAEIVLTASSKASVLDELDKRLKLALSILQIAFSYTHVKDLKQLAADVGDVILEDNKSAIYVNPSGNCPVAIEQSFIKAEVSKQRLVVSWDDNNYNHRKKYEVSYNANKRLSITSTGSSIAIGPERIKPWQDYAIQVRAINDAGASAWSFPPVYIRFSEGPPSCPNLRNIEASSRSTLKVIAQSPTAEQEVTHVYIEKRISSETAWTGEQMEVNKQGVYTLHSVDPEREYVVRIYYKNKFDFSEPSGALPVKIDDMFPSAPTDIKVSCFTKTSIAFTQRNFGAISKYQVFAGKNMWKEIEASEMINFDSNVVFPLGVSIDKIPHSMMLKAVTKNGSSAIEIPSKGVRKEKLDVEARTTLKFGLSLPLFDDNFTGRKPFLAFAPTTQQSLLPFETVEVGEQQHLEYKTLVIEAEPTVSTQFNPEW